MNAERVADAQTRINQYHDTKRGLQYMAKAVRERIEYPSWSGLSVHRTRWIYLRPAFIARNYEGRLVVAFGNPATSQYKSVL